jgi:hypothetical protein
MMVGIPTIGWVRVYHGHITLIIIMVMAAALAPAHHHHRHHVTVPIIHYGSLH